VKFPGLTMALTDLDLLAGRPRARLAVYVVAWCVCVAATATKYQHARAEFANRPAAAAETHRADGNSGHAQIDFGGQYVMGRMVVTGHGRELYRRPALWGVVREAYPVSAESPAQQAAGPGHKDHDAESMMRWVMGDDDADPAVGGPLYPPVHGLLYAPLALLPASQAYHLFQIVSVGLTFLAGFALSRITAGRVWWPAATTLVCWFPGYHSGLDLAQNHALTLAIVAGGWALHAAGRPGLAGVAWGLLAFKPVWAVAFLAVPVLLRQWRFAFTMCVTGGGLVLATLPVVGVQSWFDWLAVGQMAAAEYEVNENWTGLSRDLGGLGRRVLLDFTLPADDRASPAAAWLNRALLAAVGGLTALVALRHLGPRTAGGTGGGFVLLGAYLCCYRFMYYDAVIAALPVMVLCADPERWRVRPVTGTIDGRRADGGLNSFTLTCAVGLILLETLVMWLQIEGSLAIGRLGHGEAKVGGMPQHYPRAVLDTTVYTPCDTLLLLALWARAGVGVWAGQSANSAARAAPTSGERMSDSPTSAA